MTRSLRASALLVCAVGAVALVTISGVRSARRTAASGEGAGPGGHAWVDPAADAALAARTVDRVKHFRTGSRGTRLSLTSDELTALLRHAMPGVLPAGVVEPKVTMQEGVVTLEARLAVHDFPASEPLTSVLDIVPDTIDVDLRGRLDNRPGRLVFTIERAWASRIPLPKSAVAAVAAALAVESDDRLVSSESDAALLTLRWPDDVAVVAVVGDRMVLDRREPIAERAVDGSDAP